MICKHCGAHIKGNLVYCPECGERAVAEEPVVTPPTPEEEAYEKRLLTLSVVGLALCILGLPGLIISTIVGNKIRKRRENGGRLAGKMMAANVLSILGFIFGILLTPDILMLTIDVLIVLSVR